MLIPLALAPGCGGDSLESATAPLSEGTSVSPRRYLADTDAAAAAVAVVHPEPRRRRRGGYAPALAQVAPDLRAPLARARPSPAASTARLEDARLEEQRALAAAALGQVVAAMERATAAADAANPSGRRRGGRRLSNAVAELRAEPVMP